jgi:tRNA (cmo5U34)-methyltransferase
MNLEQVSAHFEGEAFAYDASIPKFVPHYQAQNDVMLALMPFERTAPLAALDLGAGTGVLAHLILANFPNARVMVYDLAQNMLTAARRNLAPFGPRVTFRQGNFAVDEVGAGYDLVVAGLSIHHLDHAAKRSLYRRLFQALNPAGLFLCRDVVCGPTAALTRQYEQLWCRYVRANGEDDEALMGRYQREDIPAPVEDQLLWLREAGFAEVDCYWRHLNFAIFGGQKASTTRL